MSDGLKVPSETFMVGSVAAAAAYGLARLLAGN